MADANGSDGSIEVVLEVGSEGGSLTLWRVKDSTGDWRFQFERDETSYYDILSEEDLSTMRPEDFKTIESAETLEEGLRLFGRYKWFRFVPIKIHPEYYEAILLEIRKIGNDEEVGRWVRESNRRR